MDRREYFLDYVRYNYFLNGNQIDDDMGFSIFVTLFEEFADAVKQEEIFQDT